MQSRLKISCGYIIKNEAQFLEASLESVAPYIDELLVFDSGSTDGSLEIAEKFRAKVPHFVLEKTTWKNDFAAARNAVASIAKNPWVLFIDGDEIIEAGGWVVMQEAIQNKIADCYSLIQRNYTLNAAIEGVSLVSESNLVGLKNRPSPLYSFDNWMERLYRKDSGLLYEGRIHESLLPACRRLGLRHTTLPVVLHHYGRLKSGQTEKVKYYLSLTEQKLKEEPENPAAVIELVTNLIEVEQFEEALSVARQGLRKFAKVPEVLRSAFQAALRANHFIEAESWIGLYLAERPNDVFALSQMTTALLYQRKFAQCLELANKLLSKEPGNFVAHVNCSVIHFENQDWKNALHHINAALYSKPNDEFLKEARQKVEEKISAASQKH